MGMTIDEAIKHGREQLEIFGGEHREFIEMAIKALEQEPRKGHWIGIDEEPHEDWECDNCGFAIWADENIEKFHYCPHCGAKMDGKEQKE